MRNMVKLEGYQVTNGTYTVTIQKEGKGLKAVYNCFLTKNSTMSTLFMFGWPVDQRQANEPHIFTAEEIMELAIRNSGEYADAIEEYENNIENA